MFSLPIKSAATLFALSGLLSLSAAAKADTIGNPAVPAPNVDTCMGCDYVLVGAFASAGETVLSYSLYANQAGDITPILFTESSGPVAGDAYFTITGVGQSQTVAGPGVATFSFNTTSGTAVTGPNTYFGFYSSTPTEAFSYDSGVPAVYFDGTPGDTTVGSTFDGGESATTLTNQLGGVNGRDYSINASATPEPESLSLLGMGLAGVATLVRRRRSN